MQRALGGVRAVPRAESIPQLSGWSGCCQSHHELQHLNQGCSSLFQEALSLAQGQEEVPVSVRHFPELLIAHMHMTSNSSLSLIQVSQ